MIIGIPKEVKIKEGRVSLTPIHVKNLIDKGYKVNIESEAGKLSGFSNQAYIEVGANIEPSKESLYLNSELIVKVKEPQPEDLKYLRKEHVLFCYLHLAAEPKLTEELCTIGLTAYAFETVISESKGRKILPLLAPMSDIAGKMAVHLGLKEMFSSMEGTGVLLGGSDYQGENSHKGTVSVVGAGVAGRAAAILAANIGANVKVFDINENALRELSSINPNIEGIMSKEENLLKELPKSDLIIGSVLLPGAEAPKLINKKIISELKENTVVVDIAIDQGGCVEGIKPTSYEDPCYKKDGIKYIAVTNLPGGVCRTSTEALSNAVYPYVLDLLNNPTILEHSINVKDHKVVLDAIK